MPRHYIIYDVETAGLDPQRDALVSVALLVLDGDTLSERDHFYSVVNDPGKALNPEALAVNGITLEEIAAGMELEAAIAKFNEMVAGAKTVDGYPILVAHNAEFDANFLNARGADIRFTADTMWLSRWTYPYQKANLKALCERLGIPQQDAHNALADARMTAECLRELVKVRGRFPKPMPLEILHELNAEFSAKIDARRAKREIEAQAAPA